MTQLERYSKTFTKHFKIKYCCSCRKKFKIGDKLIRTRNKRHKLYHENCYYAEPRARDKCKGCWAERKGPYLECMANDKFRETCQANARKEK